MTNNVKEMKKPINNVLPQLENDSSLTEQIKWKLLKYKLCQFTALV